MSALRLVLASLALSLASRGNLCRREPPPVLFPGADGGASASATATVAASDAATDAGLEVLRSSAIAPPGATLALEGATARAPAGHRFERYLAIDADADGDRDLFVTVAREGTTASVAYFRREPTEFVLVPGFTAAAASGEARCGAADVSSTASRSVLIEYRCQEGPANQGSIEGAEPRTREVLLVALGVNPAVRSRVETLGVARETALSVDVSARDRDGDGRDDLELLVSARAANDRAENGVSASLVWVDREGGVARDVAEPEASFTRAATALRAMATRRRAGEATAAADRLARLRRAVCSESGVARVRVDGIAGVACGRSAGLRAAAEALARARLAQGELPAAALLTHEDSASELGVVDAARLGTDFRRAMTPDAAVTALAGPTLALTLASISFPRTGALQLSPAASPSQLLLHGPLTGAAIDVRGFSPQSTTLGGSAGSPLEIATRAPDGSRAVQGFYFSCEGPFVAFCPNDAGDCIDAPRSETPPASARRVPLPGLLPPDLWGRCARDPLALMRAPMSALLRVVGYGREGLVLSMRGALYRVDANDRVTPLGPNPLGGPFPPGSSASESGAFAVVAAHEGLFVREPDGRWHLWGAAAIGARVREFTDLTINDGGQYVAGLLGSQVYLFSRLPAAPSP